MKDSRCVICKYRGDQREKKVTLEHIWRERGQPFQIPLCYVHSWELFRVGQRAFLANYRDNFMNYFGTETERELFEHLRGEKHYDPWAA
jgi:hypothetical protein